MNISLGARLGEGAEVIVYEHKLAPNLVVKIPQNRSDLETVLAERLAGERFLHQAGLSGYILETNTFVPGIADGHEYTFIETQTRIKTTLFDDIAAALIKRQVNLALKIATQFFDFEQNVLWASRVIFQDAGSFLKNIAVHNGTLKILDFSSITRNPYALDKMIVRGKAELRIKLTLEKLGDYINSKKIKPVWQEFHDGLWQLAKSHYQLDQMSKVWPSSPRSTKYEGRKAL